MSISRKFATGASAVALVTGSLVAAGVGATAATAAPHAAAKKCSSKSQGHYPPGKCTVAFTKAKYKKPASPTFLTGKVFKPGEKVTETLKCAKGYEKKLKATKARSGGAVFDSFHISKAVPKGSCTLTLTGAKSGTVLKGSFTAK